MLSCWEVLVKSRGEGEGFEMILLPASLQFVGKDKEVQLVAPKLGQFHGRTVQKSFSPVPKARQGQRGWVKLNLAIPCSPPLHHGNSGLTSLRWLKTQV